MVLSFGHNIDEEFSLAFDFQEDVLDMQQSYDMTLKPGPGQIRAYDMIPASPRAIVVRLGWDDSFFKALQSSRELLATLNEDHYKFDLSDFSTNQKELNACIVTLKSQKKVQEFAAKKIDPSTAKSLSRFQKPGVQKSDNSDLSIEVASLKEQNLALQESLDLERKKYESLMVANQDNEMRSLQEFEKKISAPLFLS